jgi:hypothetical protein
MYPESVCSQTVKANVNEKLQKGICFLLTTLRTLRTQPQADKGRFLQLHRTSCNPLKANQKQVDLGLRDRPGPSHILPGFEAESPFLSAFREGNQF